MMAWPGIAEIPGIDGSAAVALRASATAILTASLAALPALALVGLAARGRAPAALRSLAWSGALGLLLILPLLRPFVPPLLPASDGAIRVAGARSGMIDLPRPADGAARSLPVRRALPAPLRNADLPTVLAGLWALGAALLLGRLALSAVALGRLGRRARPFEDPAWTRLLDATRSELGIRRRVTLLTGPAGTMPMTWGLVRPRILLPPAARTWDAARRRAVLLHELAHIRHADQATQLLAAVAAALHWFNPLAWWAVREHRLTRELACDDRVVGAGTGALAYASELLALAREAARPSGPMAAWGAALAAGGVTRLETRVRALLDGGTRRRTTGRQAGLLTLILTLTAAAPLAALRQATPPAAQDKLHAQDAQDAPADTLASRYARAYGITLELASEIVAAAATEGIPTDIGFRLVQVESGFDARETSNMIGIGLTGILLSTARSFEPGVTQTQLYEPARNLRLGFRYLAKMLQRYDADITLGLSAYYEGPRHLERLRARGEISPYPGWVLGADGDPRGELR